MPERKIEFTGDAVSALHKFLRAAYLRGELHWESAPMVMSEHVERDSHLLEVADTLNSPGAGLSLVQCGQQHCGENGDDPNDTQHFDQRERSAAAMASLWVHVR